MVGVACRVGGGQSQLISTLDPAQAPPSGGGGDSVAPIISPDGRYVLFASLANNLVLNSNNWPLPLLFPSKLNVFLRDRTNLTTTLVSVNLAGTGGGNDNSLPAGLSSDGRYALFESSAGNLVPGDTNNAADIFIRDLTAGTTFLVSANTNGVPGDRGSRGSVMTPDGRSVAFVSDASNLVAGDTNGIADVFVRDVQAGATTLVSVGATASTSPGGGSSEFLDITPDGRYVAFYSTASNLVAGAVNSGDIYVRDLTSGTTTWASSYARTAVQLVANVANVAAYNHVLSTNGHFVAFQASPFPLGITATAGVVLRYSMFSGLTDVVNTNAAVRAGVPEDIRNLDMTPGGGFIAFVGNTNGAAGTNTCIYVWDAQAQTTTLASGDLGNNVPTNSICDWPSLDPSGRFVLFVSSATNLVTNSLVGDYHAYMRDMQSGTTSLVDASTNGAGAAISLTKVPQMTADGRFVVFECPDASLMPNDRYRVYDVFVRDLAGDTTELISACDATLPTVTPNGPSLLYSCSVSTNGRYVAIASEADNLVAGDTNGYRDIYVCDLALATNVLVSVATNGRAANSLSTDPAISGNGRFVAFTSSATNLVRISGMSAPVQNVFVRDLQAGTTVLASANSSNTGSGNRASYSPAISVDGRYVLFRSLATNLASGSFTTGYENLFLRDMQSGTNYALTHTTRVRPLGDMTPDGRFVAFYGTVSGNSTNVCVWDSQAARLVFSNTAPYFGVGTIAISPDGNRFAYTTASLNTLTAIDRETGTNWAIGNLAGSLHPGPRFSGDGRFLVYVTTVNRTNQVYLYDLQYGTNFVVSHACNSSAAAYGPSDWPAITTDGRFVAYRSSAGNIVIGDTNGLPDVFLYDRLNSATTLVSVNRFGTGAGDNRSLAPVFSGDGQTLVFQSWASDLVAQDFNCSSDLFACGLYASGEIPLFSVQIARSAGTGQGPWLMWPVVPGKNYSVQFKSSLRDADWQTLDEGVTVLGNQAYLNDLSAGPGPRFYRVVAY